MVGSMLSDLSGSLSLDDKTQHISSRSPTRFGRVAACCRVGSKTLRDRFRKANVRIWSRQKKARREAAGSSGLTRILQFFGIPGELQNYPGLVYDERRRMPGISAVGAIILLYVLRNELFYPDTHIFGSTGIPGHCNSYRVSGLFTDEKIAVEKIAGYSRLKATFL